jgi:endonuclease/exonuclease/phosphatase family metal-dependent hydrolase
VRSLLIIDLSLIPGKKLRIATSHFESLPEDKPIRLRQFKITGNALTLPRTLPILAAEQVTSQVSTPSPQGAENPSTGAGTNAPHAIIVGDTNIYNISELSPLFDPPFDFRDAYALAHDEASPADDHTFGMTFPERWGTKKIDYVLFRPGDSHAQTLVAAGIYPSSMRPVKAALLGRDPIPNMTYRGGKDGKLYPSDHLGVFVWFKGL